MTLLVAWRDTQTIHLAADSRLRSFVGTGGAADVGAKVVPLDCRIQGPSPARGSPAWVQSRRLGLAVAGSVTTAAVLQATLGSVLTSLSSIAGGGIDMEAIGSVVEAVFQQVTRDVCTAIFQNGLAELIVCGYCDTARRARAFLLDIDATAYPIRATTTEILTTAGVEYRGSGRPAAVAAARSGTPPLAVLKQVILNPNVQAVGGAVQYGRIEGQDFRLFLVRDYEADHTARTVRVAVFAHGLPVYGTVDLTLPAGYVVAGRAIDPFAQDINALISQGYQVS